MTEKRQNNQSFRNRFNTKLSKENENRFKSWLQENIDRFGVDLEDDLETYDLRGFWLEGGHSDEAFRQRKGHAPDTFKKPNHPTFSNESIYHGAKDPRGGRFEGGEWLSELEFRPSRKMLETTHKPADWIPFMQAFGEGVKPIIDDDNRPATPDDSRFLRKPLR